MLHPIIFINRKLFLFFALPSLEQTAHLALIGK